MGRQAVRLELVDVHLLACVVRRWPRLAVAAVMVVVAVQACSQAVSTEQPPHVILDPAISKRGNDHKPVRVVIGVDVV